MAPEQHDDDEDRQLCQGTRPNHQHAVAESAGGEALAHGADSS